MQPNSVQSRRVAKHKAMIVTYLSLTYTRLYVVNPYYSNARLNLQIPKDGKFNH